ncbi:DUF4445 domain-containing protein [Geobacter pelophilus]|uniref:DUF4445 domain-containing protein n=1 Tax=Geoanaerobacter pelophilus TaxID=60036 RepID=A0AAW4KYJ1_9BACT|nr:ASKHA domain-containing protein [Geoanaerobacter pelophilus]MBT0663434.1 DUF4445 domain-containing protein [Geoanaerobacter pelophilus]
MSENPSLPLTNAPCLAVDLGTTTIAASIIDGETGKRLALTTALNPQRPYGADVISRVAAAAGSETLRHEMSRLINRQLEDLAAAMLEDIGLAAGALKKVAIAGNPAMEHLLLDLPVDTLAGIPFRPLFSAGKVSDTSVLGWADHAEAYIFPVPGGFVGGDLVAFLYGQGLGQISAAEFPRLFLDLGTNAEIALHVGEKVYVTSAAAGPAFEGGNLSCGMPALAGAITSVSIDHERVVITTLDNASPQGLCGTGALTLIAALLAENVIDASGMLLEPSKISSNLANRIKDVNGVRAFVVYRDASREILLTQEDIRQIQFAKAAIRAGIEMLVARGGMEFSDICELVITGSFGERLGTQMLQVLDIVPPGDCRPAYVLQGPLQGAERYLCNVDGSDTPDTLMGKLTVVPLSGNPRFEANFIKFMDFCSNCYTEKI